jgi:hypothetical protein
MKGEVEFEALRIEAPQGTCFHDAAHPRLHGAGQALPAVLDNLFGDVKSVSCIAATHIPERVDEAGSPTSRPPTMRPMPPSSSKAASSPTST